MKINKIIVAISSLILLLSSCNKWLEVPVDGQSTSKELFEIGDGYRTALNGLYSEMSSPTLYGRELQWGVVDFFSNQYKIDVPKTDLSNPLYLAAGKRDYKETHLLPLIDNIWLKAYNVIASANNLVDNIKGEEAKKFDQGEMEQNLILGEAMAIRAFIHFDMLRLFAPAPISDDGAVYVPYVKSFPNTAAQRTSVKDVLQQIIKDLEEARALVKPFDESALGQSGIASGNARYYNELVFGMEGATNPSKVDQFFLGRGYRFSYWAITALLARVYQYNAVFVPEDLEKAKTYAEEVLELKVVGINKMEHFPFKDENFSGFEWQDAQEEMFDIRMVSNLIFGVYNEKEQQDAGLDTFFPREKGRVSSSLFIVDKDRQKIFITVDGADDTAEDIRAKRLLYMPRGAFNSYISTKWYVNEKKVDIRNRTITILPLIRTSEMRYIIAEYYAEKNDLVKAYEIINEMRQHRKVKALDVKKTKEEFLKDFVREAQREWISEGQLFYLYKRLNFPVIREDNTEKPFTKEEAVLPLPAGETV